jgi:hypothetical protein
MNKLKLIALNHKKGDVVKLTWADLELPGQPEFDSGYDIVDAKLFKGGLTRVRDTPESIEARVIE